MLIGSRRVLLSMFAILAAPVALAATPLPVPPAPPEPPRPAQLESAEARYRCGDFPSYILPTARAPYSGITWLRILVDKQGRVRDVRLEGGSGIAKWDRSLAGLIREWQFRPRVELGQHQSATVQMRVELDAASEQVRIFLLESAKGTGWQVHESACPTG